VDGFSAQQVRQRVAAPPPPPPPPAAPAPLLKSADSLSRNAGPNTEAYDRIVDNPFIRASQEQLATFSIDVDTASYANMRRFLTQNQMPPRDSVRIEELINYFNYDYAQPAGRDPIAPNMEVAVTPWNPQSRLVRIGIKAREVNANRRPPSNLVFLIDVSGSMNTPTKLPLVKAGLRMMVDRLGENDTVSMVVYAGASGLVLAPTSAIRKEVIQQAIDRLEAGGSTNGASGIQLAYNQAVANFIRGGTNRVILMTDGDFNVGITNQGDLTRLIEERAKSGVFLSVLGFGMGNIKDSTLEKLADQGNGHYAYIDSVNEAHKVLVEEMGSTLVTVAKDVKIQVDFNPGRVEAYRLIGYENRVLRTEDFNNDLKDAGDMGAGHTVTALFEVIPKGGSIPGPSIDPSKYTAPAANLEAARIPANTSNELLTLRVRYKQPDSDTSSRMDVPLVDQGRTFARATADFRFAAAVAEFGMILRESPYRGNASLDTVLELAEGSRGQDRNGYRQEFIQLVQRAKRLR
jgi:Ca-activated chloride channel family protein